MTKVIISVRGGIVQEVHSDDPELKVEIYDWDNIREGFEGESEGGLPLSMEDAYEAYIANEEKDYEHAIDGMELVG